MTKEMKAELIIQFEEELEYRAEGERIEDPMMLIGNRMYFSKADIKELLKLVREAEVEDDELRED